MNHQHRLTVSEELRPTPKPVPRIKGTAISALVLTAALSITACSSGNDSSRGNDSGSAMSNDSAYSVEQQPTESTAQEEAAEETAIEQNRSDSNEQTDDTEILPPEQIPTALLQGKEAAVYRQLTPAFQQVLTQQQLVDTVQSSLQNVASFEQLGKAIMLNHHTQYNWLDNNGKLGLTAIVDEQGKIAGLQLQPIQSFPATDQKLTTATYRLPLQGDWFVFWGGSNVLQNYHYAVESQRYAYDFIQVKDGMSYSGDATRNESYYAFGQPALAPADGTVVAVVNNIADNEPVGNMNPQQPAGNSVVIRHGNEYSLLGHLQKGSVTVNKGDTVQAGQIIGKIGNSGNSSEAHLHFQVADRPDLARGTSIPIRWQGEIEPVKGQTVTNGG
ncbi:M23 family metallopeptidase [Paenibacillus sp. WLX2291]|uniref:M23 family metallopeptidase n=1 Tax=Paenibacillus sp. WLX2291 TaxID=3296934 RepID=UPI003983EA88